MVFMQPQRLVVPLFQRSYVWNQENQWEPLWDDIVRVAERVLARPQDRHYPHFLGAVVLQQVLKQTGQMQERTIIDGQQRLTTLQLLLDALHAELLAVGAQQPAARIEPLVSNAAPFCSRPEDCFKVWPTNRDRASFNAVMGAPPPVDHDSLGHPGERMVEAHRFFSEQAREWLSAKPSMVQERAAAVETVVRELLQVVVIDLAADENAQEIFETLNARGAQLTAADLVKNFIFQRLLESGADVDSAYQTNWKEFETGFWETEISVGRLRYPRSALFLNHWLVARTGEEVVAREVFDRFKRFADHEAGVPMDRLLGQVHAAAGVYRNFISGTTAQTGPIDRLALFGYRTGALESEVVKPFVLSLLDPEATPIPADQLTRAIEGLESWMVRRMLVRATTKNYNAVVAELVATVLRSGRQNAGDAIEKYLSSQTSESRYWPDDDEVRLQVRTLQAYRRLSRGRLRMLLEAIEDYQRGWRFGHQGLGDERVVRGKFAIEHVMPRKWHTHWPLPDGREEGDRDHLVHTLGNLTLLTGRLNSKVSNGPWLGRGGKREGLEAHDVLFLNRDLLKAAGESWSDDAIDDRTRGLIETIIAIWPVPQGHRSGFSAERRPSLRKKVYLSDLVVGGALQPGITLFPRGKRFKDRTATILADGRLEIEGQIFASPSEAAVSMTGRPTNGWGFFLVDQASKRSLRAVRLEYVEAMAVDDEEDEGPEDGDEDDG
jgi:hypothetical protein